MSGYANLPRQAQWGPPPPRGGSGKALPIAIGAGLAVGVFLGLLLIRGTGGEKEAVAETVEPPTTAANDIDAGAAAALDASTVAVAIPDAAPAIPAVKTLTLTLAVTPTDAEDLEITVDGEPLTGTTFAAELAPDADAKKVKLKVTAKGHYTYRQTIKLEQDTTHEVELKERRRSGGGGHKPTGPGGLIDL